MKIYTTTQHLPPYDEKEAMQKYWEKGEIELANMRNKKSELVQNENMSVEEKWHHRKKRKKAMKAKLSKKYEKVEKAYDKKEEKMEKKHEAFHDKEMIKAIKGKKKPCKDRK